MFGRSLRRVFCVDGRRFVFRRRYHENYEMETSVSRAQIKSTLKLSGMNVVEGHACIISSCPFCKNKKSPKEPRLFINKTTGFFLCGTCRYFGPWNTLERYVKICKNDQKYAKELKLLTDSLQVEKSYNKEWDEIKNRSEMLAKLPIDMYKDVLHKFELPDVPQDSISQLNCLYDQTASLLHLPLTSVNPSVIAGYKTLTSDSSTESTSPALKCSGILLYRQKGARTDDSLLLVPTVRDLLAVVGSRAAPSVACLPHGLHSLPQHALSCLESYKTLTLWFGNDEPSWDTARQFAKKLNEQRCHFVRPTDEQPRPALAAQLGLDLRAIAQKAQSICHKSITTFKTLRQDVLSDLQNVDKVQGVKWKRYPALNKFLKGHRRGEFTILTGPTGSGKTTFMSEYSLDLAMQGVNTLWGSFEIRNARLAKTMLQQMAGVRLDNNLDKFDHFADEFEKLPIYFMTFHGQQSVKVVMEAVEHATYVHDISHVIIDNVQFMMGMSEEPKHVDRFWKQDKIIAAFRSFATNYNCHVTLVIHPRKERDNEELTTASIFGGAKASQEADNILIIQDKRLQSVRGKKYLQISKNRYSGDLGMMVLDFDKESLSYAHKKKPRDGKEKEDDARSEENEMKESRII